MRDGARIVFEASGGCDHGLRTTLAAAEVRFSRVDPRPARDFARSMGVTGKTDHVDARMAALLAADPELAAVDRRLKTVPGVGPVVAAPPIAELPELGRLDSRRIAALAAGAPIARDSGKRLGVEPSVAGAPSSGQCPPSLRFAPPGGARCSRPSAAA